MYCPYCKSEKVKVVDKRDNDETNTSRRRRECESCERRFTTYERVERVILNVIKRDGAVEEFDREKIKSGILKAVKKRQIPEEKIEGIVQNIESTLMSRETQNIKSVEIGELVLQELTKVDKLGALLFASVYRDFKSLEDVEEALKKFSE